MNEETKSEILSWEEWVEQLVNMPEQKQFTELLNKAKEMKDRNTDMERYIGDKRKEIAGLKEQVVYKDNEIKQLRHRCKDIEGKMYCLKREGEKHIRRLRVFLAIVGMCIFIITAILLTTPFL